MLSSKTEEIHPAQRSSIYQRQAKKAASGCESLQARITLFPERFAAEPIHTWRLQRSSTKPVLVTAG